MVVHFGHSQQARLTTSKQIERRRERKRGRNRQRGREWEWETLPERAIRVAGCGSIVKVSEPRSKKSRHLTPSPPSPPVCFPAVHPLSSPSVPPSVSSAHSAHTWRKSDLTDCTNILSLHHHHSRGIYNYSRYIIWLKQKHKKVKRAIQLHDVAEHLTASLSLIK